MRYKDKREFIFGTLSFRSGAKEHEIEKALIEKALEHMPEGFTLVELMRGAIFFVEEDPQI